MGSSKNQNKAVFVAMSGGVDSSVAASLLQKEGFSVVGVYMKCWSEGPGYSATSCFGKDLEDARRVAQKLDIPFQVFDFEQEYRAKVMDYFFSEYQKGRTPNPDVECNREIKFGLFLEKAKEMGADMIATGHHVRRRRNNQDQGSKIKDPRYELLKGVDKNKDQSYFLWTLGQKELEGSLFAVGEYTKEEVRKKARKLGLSTHDKPDSTGICFVGEVDIREFLKKNIGTNPGPIVNHQGKKIGEHDGLWFYTLGQRQGIGIGGGIPYYVYQKNVENNALKVVPKRLERKYLYKSELTASDLNWITDRPRFPLECKAKIRYLQPEQACRVEEVDDDDDNDRARVVFDELQRAITPGQSIVFYSGDIVLGGGIID